MASIHKSVLVLHSAEKMYTLVDRVEDYPQFLPWYGKTEVYMDYMGINQSFATHNHNTPPQKSRMNLLEGPFQSLHGTWQFIDLGDEMCKVEFVLHYELTGILSRLIAPVFSSITGRLVDAFVQEANKRYG